MIMYHLGPQLGVWIMQVSTFSSVLINRFHCTSTLRMNSLCHQCNLLGLIVLIIQGKLAGKAINHPQIYQHQVRHILYVCTVYMFELLCVYTYICWN